MGLLQTLTVKKDGIVFVIVGTDEVTLFLRRSGSICGYSVCLQIWIPEYRLSKRNVRAKLTGTFYVNECNPIADEFSNSKRNKK